MTKQEQEQLAEELDGIDFKELAQQGSKITVPVEIVVALAKGKLSHREAFGISNESIQNVTRYAYRLLECGHHEAAAEIFDALVALDPKVAYFHIGLGTALAGLGHNQPAIECFEEARKLDPRDLTAHYNLAELMLAEGRKDEASGLLAEARALDPGRHHPMATMIQRLWIAHFEPA